MSESANLSVRCPECGSELVVDRQTGEVVFHKQPKAAPAEGKSFDALFADLESQKNRADDIFERERAALKDRDRLMEEKFREAMKRAEEDPDTGRPVRPFDLD